MLVCRPSTRSNRCQGAGLWSETHAMSHPPAYEPSPHTSGTPLRLDEIEALQFAGAKPVLKNQQALLHLLDRMAAALRESRSQQATLIEELELARARKAQAAHPVEEAKAALAALTEEQMRALLDASYWAAVDELNAERETLAHTQLAAVSALRKVRFRLAQLADEPQLPEEAAALIRAALDDIPLPPPTL